MGSRRGRQAPLGTQVGKALRSHWRNQPIARGLFAQQGRPSMIRRSTLLALAYIAVSSAAFAQGGGGGSVAALAVAQVQQQVLAQERGPRRAVRHPSPRHRPALGIHGNHHRRQREHQQHAVESERPTSYREWEDPCFDASRAKLRGRSCRQRVANWKPRIGHQRGRPEISQG